MLGHGRLADGQGPDEVPDGPLAIAEEIEDAPAVALGQDLECRQHPLSIARELYSWQGTSSMRAYHPCPGPPVGKGACTAKW